MTNTTEFDVPAWLNPASFGIQPAAAEEMRQLAEQLRTLTRDVLSTLDRVKALDVEVGDKIHAADAPDDVVKIMLTETGSLAVWDLASVLEGACGKFTGCSVTDDELSRLVALYAVADN